MSSKGDLSEIQSHLRSTRITDQRKAIVRLKELLSHENIRDHLNSNDPLSWRELLEELQSSLQKECYRSVEQSKQNVFQVVDCITLVVQMALKHGPDKISVSRLVRYVDGVLRENNMNLCKDAFLTMIKDCILENFHCLGYLEPEDFKLLFKLLQSELSQALENTSRQFIIYNCLLLLIKNGPLCGFPCGFLREQFSFVSQLTQSLKKDDLRSLQEIKVLTVLNFCKHCAEDNRLSCCKLGEEVFSCLANLYTYGGFDAKLKVDIVEFFLLQMTIHHPNGVRKGDKHALAWKWDIWNSCVKKMYSLLTNEISQYLSQYKQYIKSTYIFLNKGDNQTIILNSFVALFVEVSKQLLSEIEGATDFYLIENSDVEGPSQKRRKVVASLESFVDEIRKTKSWVWVNLVCALLHKYPTLINKHLYQNLIQTLHNLLLNTKEVNTIRCIYETQAILVEIEPNLNFYDDEILNLWKLIGDAAMRVVGSPNHNIEETQHLLSQLISRQIVPLESVIDTFTSGVLIIAKHHIDTLELVLKCNRTFSQLTHAQRTKIFDCLINTNAQLDDDYLLNWKLAEMLVALTLKQYPNFQYTSRYNKKPSVYQKLCNSYARNTFVLKKAPLHIESSDKLTSFNPDPYMVKTLMDKLEVITHEVLSKSMYCIFSLLGCLYNVLSCFIDCHVIEESEIEGHQLMKMIKILVENGTNNSLNNYSHNENKFKELLKLTHVLTKVFSLANSATSLVKRLFPMKFFQEIFNLLNPENVQKQGEFQQKVKLSLITTLSKYCVVTNPDDITLNQHKIVMVLAEPDYNFSNDMDYDLIVCFLNNIVCTKPGLLSEDVVEKILDCIHGLCSSRYRNYNNALEVINILNRTFGHCFRIDSSYSSMAISMIYPFYKRVFYYGPEVAEAILNVLHTLVQLDPTCQLAKWDDKEVIRYVPEFLTNEFQRVRFKAVEVLVDFIKVSTNLGDLNSLHLLEEVFHSIYDFSIQVLQVNETMNDERAYDETTNRSWSAFYMFLSIIVNCNSWCEESLFAIVKMEHYRKLHGLRDEALIKDVFSRLKEHFKNQDFLISHLTSLLNRWIDFRYDINEFVFQLFGCSDKMHFYFKYFNICAPLLYYKDQNDILAVGRQLNMTEISVVEYCCPKFFAHTITYNVSSLSEDFIKKNAELSKIHQILGDKMQKTLVTHLDQLILTCVNTVTDSRDYETVFQETVYFISKGITREDFYVCLNFIQNQVCNGTSLIDFLINSRETKKIQNILLKLQSNIYATTTDEQLKRTFHHYTIIVNMILQSLDPNSEIIVFFIRDTLHYLVQSILNKHLEKICQAIVRFMNEFLQKLLPKCSKEFEPFLKFVVNTIKNVAIESESLLPPCKKILEFLVISNESDLSSTIAKLDNFPNNEDFKAIKDVHNRIKYFEKKLCLKEEIEIFLDYTDAATKHDSLVHLKSILANEKAQLNALHDELLNETTENSLLHKLIATLIKMSAFPNEKINREAIRCLGEIGPVNLTATIVPEPEKNRDFCDNGTAFDDLTCQVLCFLNEYIVDADMNVKSAASEALYHVLRYEQCKKILDGGKSELNKKYIAPYLMQIQEKSSNKLLLNNELFMKKVNIPNLWCPLSSTVDYKEWITNLVVALLESFDHGSYLNSLIGLCKVQATFCENILPLLINLLISHFGDKRVIEVLSANINQMFSKHWCLTIDTTYNNENVMSIAVNKESVTCMLDVVNFIRNRLTSTKLTAMKFDYLRIAKAAAYCSAHFSALLYSELWCQEKIDENNLRNSNSLDQFATHLDTIYKSEANGTTLQEILQSSYKSIGELDALSGCGLSLFRDSHYRINYYKSIGQWDRVMDYYSIRPWDTATDGANLLESFKMNYLYQLPLKFQSEKVDYECMWRLGQWIIPSCDNSEQHEVNYEKNKFNCLKAICDYDLYTFTTSKKELETYFVENLKHISIESNTNLYPVLSQLESFVEMEDCLETLKQQSFKDMLDKWKSQDLIIKKNDFQFIEPIIAQRITLLKELSMKNSNLANAYYEVVLNFADYAKQENCLRAATTALIRLRQMPNLSSEMDMELQLREAQLAWLNNEKLFSQWILSELCNTGNVSDRLKAKSLMLQAVFMSESDSKRRLVLNNFEASLEAYQRIESLDRTNEDRSNIQDTYDRLAMYADREYQQIMSHINSNLYQKNISIVKSYKEITFSEQNHRTTDEKKANILRVKQIKIDETEINRTQNEKNFVLQLALKYYIQNLATCDTNNLKIFRVISLFLENRDNDLLSCLLKHMTLTLPSYKYVTVLPQLIPHLTCHDLLGEEINKIIKRCALDHPHHTLPQLLALVNAMADRKYCPKENKSQATVSNERTEEAIKMLSKLEHSGLKEIIRRMSRLSNALIQLAYYSENNSRRSEVNIPLKLAITSIKDFDDILVPTCTLPVSKTNTYKNIVGISKFNRNYTALGGITAPKRIECVCTRGKVHFQLVKGQDDLRQDAVMQQAFTIINNLLSNDKKTKSLQIRTYKVVPLSMRSGVLEWVENSMPIGDYLLEAHKKFRPNDDRPAACKRKIADYATQSSDVKLKVFKKICENIQPVFHKFFEIHFKQPSAWYKKRRAYIHSVATSSMCGHILGIGDRHVNNILIDKKTAEVIHIDFGIAFEQGKCLPTPEMVPFRLTRDIVDGMGVSGIEGLFRKSCEKTMEVLRSNSQTILSILEVLLYDPLYYWVVTKNEANKRQIDESSRKCLTDDIDEDNKNEENKNINAERVLLRLGAKLQGCEDGKLRSIEYEVGNLIRQAMDPENHCVMFHGWQAYL
ncbi:hypothetical protein ABEB36_006509 [Hypothenemus hampei]|uniref:Serine/threonine-protein kinase ATM n=1 Tax=Hypothenemus hampei TaxID=57062 RepID=A0ABD1EQR9_HYPHA